ncbi:hypothetical protein DFP72DRAFT_862774 [Ephemerocybe angulata]|uniref:Uncharacterized protein n=1 Tax=Ephemerocybe angulata TaxID=980116 RepID=A0A8H6H6C1_9AGAR|nr:hypothetical protein DFP72DRAFT_862774 [Tulosesus angulatus]
MALSRICTPASLDPRRCRLLDSELSYLLEMLSNHRFPSAVVGSLCGGRATKKSEEIAGRACVRYIPSLGKLLKPSSQPPRKKKNIDKRDALERSIRTGWTGWTGWTSWTSWTTPAKSNACKGASTAMPWISENMKRRRLNRSGRLLRGGSVTSDGVGSAGEIIERRTNHSRTNSLVKGIASMKLKPSSPQLGVPAESAATTRKRWKDQYKGSYENVSQYPTSGATQGVDVKMGSADPVEGLLKSNTKELLPRRPQNKVRSGRPIASLVTPGVPVPNGAHATRKVEIDDGASGEKPVAEAQSACQDGVDSEMGDDEERPVRRVRGRKHEEEIEDGASGEKLVAEAQSACQDGVDSEMGDDEERPVRRVRGRKHEEEIEDGASGEKPVAEAQSACQDGVDSEMGDEEERPVRRVRGRKHEASGEKPVAAAQSARQDVVDSEMGDEEERPVRRLRGRKYEEEIEDRASGEKFVAEAQSARQDAVESEMGDEEPRPVRRLRGRKYEEEIDDGASGEKPVAEAQSACQDAVDSEMGDDEGQPVRRVCGRKHEEELDSVRPYTNGMDAMLPRNNDVQKELEGYNAPAGLLESVDFRNTEGMDLDHHDDDLVKRKTLRGCEGEMTDLHSLDSKGALIRSPSDEMQSDEEEEEKGVTDRHVRRYEGDATQVDSSGETEKPKEFDGATEFGTYVPGSANVANMKVMELDHQEVVVPKEVRCEEGTTPANDFSGAAESPGGVLEGTTPANDFSGAAESPGGVWESASVSHGQGMQPDYQEEDPMVSGQVRSHEEELDPPNELRGAESRGDASGSAKVPNTEEMELDDQEEDLPVRRQVRRHEEELDLDPLNELRGAESRGDASGSAKVPNTEETELDDQEEDRPVRRQVRRHEEELDPPNELRGGAESRGDASGSAKVPNTEETELDDQEEDRPKSWIWIPSTSSGEVRNVVEMRQGIAKVPNTEEMELDQEEDLPVRRQVRRHEEELDPPNELRGGAESRGDASGSAKVPNTEEMELDQEEDLPKSWIRPTSSGEAESRGDASGSAKVPNTEEMELDQEEDLPVRRQVRRHEEELDLDPPNELRGGAACRGDASGIAKVPNTEEMELDQEEDPMVSGQVRSHDEELDPPNELTEWRGDASGIAKVPNTEEMELDQEEDLPVRRQVRRHEEELDPPNELRGAESRGDASGSAKVPNTEEMELDDQEEDLPVRRQVRRHEEELDPPNELRGAESRGDASGSAKVPNTEEMELDDQEEDLPVRRQVRRHEEELDPPNELRGAESRGDASGSAKVPNTEEMELDDQEEDLPVRRQVRRHEEELDPLNELRGAESRGDASGSAKVPNTEEMELDDQEEDLPVRRQVRRHEEELDLDPPNELTEWRGDASGIAKVPNTETELDHREEVLPNEAHCEEEVDAHKQFSVGKDSREGDMSNSGRGTSAQGIQLARRGEDLVTCEQVRHDQGSVGRVDGLSALKTNNQLGPYANVLPSLKAFRKHQEETDERSFGTYGPLRSREHQYVSLSAGEDDLVVRKRVISYQDEDVDIVLDHVDTPVVYPELDFLGEKVDGEGILLDDQENLLAIQRRERILHQEEMGAYGEPGDDGALSHSSKCAALIADGSADDMQSDDQQDDLLSRTDIKRYQGKVGKGSVSNGPSRRTQSQTVVSLFGRKGADMQLHFPQDELVKRRDFGLYQDERDPLRAGSEAFGGSWSFFLEDETPVRRTQVPRLALVEDDMEVDETPVRRTQVPRLALVEDGMELPPGPQHPGNHPFQGARAPLEWVSGDEEPVLRNDHLTFCEDMGNGNCTIQQLYPSGRQHRDRRIQDTRRPDDDGRKAPPRYAPPAFTGGSNRVTKPIRLEEEEIDDGSGIGFHGDSESDRGKDVSPRAGFGRRVKTRHAPKSSTEREDTSGYDKNNSNDDVCSSLFDKDDLVRKSDLNRIRTYESSDGESQFQNADAHAQIPNEELDNAATVPCWPLSEDMTPARQRDVALLYNWIQTYKPRGVQTAPSAEEDTAERPEPKPRHRLNKTRHRAVDRNVLHKRVRTKVQELMGRESSNSPLSSINFALVRRWGQNRELGPNLEKFEVVFDFDSLSKEDKALAREWNAEAAHVFAEHFSDKYPCHDKKEAEECFLVHITRTLKAAWRAFMAGNNNGAREDELYYKAAIARRERRHGRRLRVCELFQKEPGMEVFVELFRRSLRWNGCSGDEREEGDGSNLVITTLPWRAKEVRRFMQDLDNIDLALRFRYSYKSIAGNFPLPRSMPRHPKTVIERLNLRPPAGLPSNFYSTEWLGSLTKSEVDALGMTEAIELKIPQDLKAYADTACTVNGRHTRPLPQDYED